jgi:hypothetical protein
VGRIRPKGRGRIVKPMMRLHITMQSWRWAKQKRECLLSPISMTRCLNLEVFQDLEGRGGGAGYAMLCHAAVVIGTSSLHLPSRVSPISSLGAADEPHAPDCAHYQALWLTKGLLTSLGGMCVCMYERACFGPLYTYRPAQFPSRPIASNFSSLCTRIKHGKKRPQSFFHSFDHSDLQSLNECGFACLVYQHKF